MALRLIFMGTPDFAVPTLVELAGQGHDIAAVYTRAAKPAGRGMELQPTPVEREARKLGLPVLTPATLKNPEAQQAFAAHGADAAIVVAYGLILPKPILDAPRLGCFNVHASLLPRWRGAAPINRAVMAGDAASGITVMKMDEGLDTGAMAIMERLPISADMTAGDLHDALMRLGADLMARSLSALERGHAAIHAAADGGCDLRQENRQGRDADRLGEVLGRGAQPLSRPVAFSRRVVRDAGRRPRQGAAHHTRAGAVARPGTALDDRLTIACGEGAVRIVELQRAGKQPMKADDFLRGTAIPRNARLG